MDKSIDRFVGVRQIVLEVSGLDSGRSDPAEIPTSTLPTQLADRYLAPTLLTHSTLSLTPQVSELLTDILSEAADIINRSPP